MGWARTVLAIVLGFFTVIVASLLLLIFVNLVTKGHPSVVAAECAVLLGAVIAGVVTARAAPERPVSHAMALAVAIFAIGIAGAITTRDATPPWYRATIAIITAVGIIAGALIAGPRVKAPPI